MVNIKIKKMRVLVLVLLVVAGVSLSTFTYVYSADLDLISGMMLPTITAGDVVTLNLEFFKDTGYSPTFVRITLGNSSFISISQLQLALA